MGVEQYAERSIQDRVSSFSRRLAGIYNRLDPSAKLASWVIVGIILLAVFAQPIRIPGQIPVLSGQTVQPISLTPHDPAEPNYDASLQEPSLTHPLGTDLTGRDVLSRLILGARASLLVGVFAVGAAMIVGSALGSIAGYVGGWLDETIMRLMDVVISVPALVLALALVGTIGASLTNIIFVIALVYTPQYARLIRGKVLSVKENEYIEAAKNTGLSDMSILRKHVIPNSTTPVVVQATYHVATAIILEASLSFLGLGVQPPRPSWGLMIANGRDYLPTSWWLTTFAGLMIMITVLSFNVLGDGLRDEFDPEDETRGGSGA